MRVVMERFIYKGEDGYYIYVVKENEDSAIQYLCYDRVTPILIGRAGAFDNLETLSCQDFIQEFEEFIKSDDSKRNMSNYKELIGLGQTVLDKIRLKEGRRKLTKTWYYNYGSYNKDMITLCNIANLLKGYPRSNQEDNSKSLVRKD